MSILPIITALILCASEGFQGELGSVGVDVLRLPPLGHSLVGTALGLVLVLNNASTTAGGRGESSGGHVNASRNLARQARSYGGELRTLSPLICAFPCALKHQLRSEPSHKRSRGSWALRIIS